jgi:uncharacterized membrane protein YcaP (DUF421 family)
MIEKRRKHMGAFFALLFKIFFGESLNIVHLFEVIFRTAFMFFYTIFNVRLMDKRSMGLLTPFEIIIIIALGSAVGDPMFYRDIPLVQGMLVISTIVFLERVITKITVKSIFFERIINGEPTLIVKQGKLQKKEMDQQNLTKEELYSMLRLRGIKNIADVDLAYLEPSGSISIIKNGSVKDEDMVPQKRLL